MAKLVEDRQPISMDPDDFESPGLLNNVDVVVKSAAYKLFDYGGRATSSPALMLGLLPDGLEDTTEQYWSAGSAERLEPTEDGEFLIPTNGSGVKGLSNSCNAALFFTSLKAAGFPMGELSSGISVLIGMKFHLLRVPQPKRAGMVKQEGEREKTVATVAEIISMPKGMKTGKGVKVKAKKEEEQEEVTETTAAQDAVVELLSEGPIPKSKLYNTVFVAVKKHQERRRILEDIQEDDFITQGEAAGLWTLDGNKITLREEEE